MVKPDVKHNYYADLELPTNASIEDVRKAYRKLALQYHPDRNAGKEGECVPKFQAIQQAHEVLGDAAVKQKYDVDRRKAGLYPMQPTTGFTPRHPTTGNPYTATSNYPPPPRRTQPGTWGQRPPPAPSASANAAGGTGADRFSNFPRPSPPTAKKDHAQDRANMFQAWQNMNTPQGRQSRFSTQQTPPQPAPQAQQQAQPFSGTARRQPPQPPPRPTNAMPSEDQIRAGTKYKQPPPPPDMDGLNERQSNWRAFEQNGPQKPGINRSNTTRTPKRQGFNPNAPGSDERAAPSTGAGYMHRNKSADFGKPRQFPPPPAGAPPAGQMPTSPTSPQVSPKNARPGTDPTRPDRTQAPYAEGNRERKPYSSFIGEKTDFGGDHLRRSYSTRDHSKLGPDDAENRNRARSSSPPRREATAANQSSGGKPFAMYSSSSASSSTSNMAQTPEGYDSAPDRQRPGQAPDVPSNRPKKVPNPPSSRLNGSRSGPTSPVPPTPGSSAVNGDGMQSEDMQQKSKPSMYANPSLFDQQSWVTAMFGSLSTSRAKQSGPKVPRWAIPASLNPSLKRDKPIAVESQPYTTAADRVYICATIDEQQAYIRFQALLQEGYDCVPSNLDMDLFNRLVSCSRRGITTGKRQLDQILRRLLTEFPSVGADGTSSTLADNGPRANSFSFPKAHDLFATNGHKSRSEEQINTKFSPDGWHGTFTGEPGYFAPPNGTSKPRSPSGRPTSSRTTSTARRAATMDVPPTPSSETNAEAAQRLWGSDGQSKEVPPLSFTSPSPGFSTSDWQNKFSDPSWTMPPPPPNPPSPSKAAGSTAGSRRPSRTLRAKKGQTFESHVDGVTVEVEDDDGKHDSGGPTVEDYDAMDIDDTPPAQRKTDQTQNTSTQAEKEARLYSVPPSAWRQQQEEAQAPNRHRATSSASRRAQRASASSASGSRLNTNLDDLRNVEPIARSAGPAVGGGFSTMSSIGDDLPFQSAPAKSIPRGALQKLDIPNVPVVPELPRRWSKLSWHMYAEHFADYLKRHHEFNKTMLQYFAVRLQSDEKLIGTGDKTWMEASGVTSDGIGFDAYAKDVRSDEEMRTAWDIGCERHRKAVKEFGESRERVRSMAQTGTLQD